jgi:aspartate aminotransferase-like enzyme
MLLTPGPTAVPEAVREAMAREQPNPDVEPAFRETYAETCERLRRVHGTDDDVVVLGGEGILGLEAAVASLVGPGDSVLCVSNGLYGDGFAEFVADYGGEATLVSADDDGPLDADAVAAELERGEYDLATMVHCETPTGTLNDLDPVLDLLDDHGVLSVVDAVSSLGGVDVPVERIDVCLAASQKCFSAPPGLATAAVSDAAWERMDERETRGVYTDLRPWRDVSGGFPYTHLAANVAALHRALGLLLSEGLEEAYARHERAAERCRERAAELGVGLYPDPERSSPTVTALAVPGRASELQATLAADHDVVLATGLAEHAEDVLRVGHMGYGADVERVDRAMDALSAEL